MRRAGRSDREDWLRLRCASSPGIDLARHEREVDAVLGRPYQAVGLLGIVGNRAVALAEISRRPHLVGCAVDGCESTPVGYLEAIYVEPGYRGRGVARALVSRAEQWAGAHGCRVLASGAAVDDAPGQAVHVRLGFDEVQRMVVFRRAIADQPAAIPGSRAAAPTAPEVRPAAGRSAGRWLIHGPLMLGGLLSVLFTDVWSKDPVNGAILPLVDVAFAVYLAGFVTVYLFRRRTARADDAYGRLLEPGSASDAGRARPEGGRSGPDPLS